MGSRLLRTYLKDFIALPEKYYCRTGKYICSKNTLNGFKRGILRKKSCVFTHKRTFFSRFSKINCILIVKTEFLFYFCDPLIRILTIKQNK